MICPFLVTNEIYSIYHTIKFPSSPKSNHDIIQLQIYKINWTQQEKIWRYLLCESTFVRPGVKTNLANEKKNQLNILRPVGGTMYLYCLDYVYDFYFLFMVMGVTLVDLAGVNWLNWNTWQKAVNQMIFYRSYLPCDGQKWYMLYLGRARERTGSIIW